MTDRWGDLHIVLVEGLLHAKVIDPDEEEERGRERERGQR